MEGGDWEAESTSKERSQEEGRRPRARDYFCGPNVPVGRALTWMGWEVDAIDWLLDPAQDLSDPQYQAQLAESLPNYEAHILAIECSTLTRAREKPIPGHPNPPVQLRSESKPRGLDKLSRADEYKVRHADSYIDLPWRQQRERMRQVHWWW